MIAIKGHMQKFFSKLSFKQWFANDAEEDGAPEEDDALLNLYWNRAQLKRELSKLQKEKTKVQELLGESQTETNQVREEIRALEKRIGQPQHAFSTVVYFQLINLWESCKTQLNSFANDLKGQQEERERKEMIMAFNQKREEQLQSLGVVIEKAKFESGKNKDSLNDIQQRIESLSGLFGFFKRRSLQPLLDENRKRYSESRDQLEKCYEKRAEVESQPWPEYPGLKIKGKRIINLAVISFAQYLFLHFHENSLAQMSRTAKIKSVHDANFGSREDCEYLMKRISQAMRAMKADEGFGVDLKARAKMLRKRAQYRNEGDTVPMASSLSTIPVLQPTKSVSSGSVEMNVLADDYWNVLSILIH